MDFYSATSAQASKLSSTEQNIFKYVVKNMHLVKNMSIRELATACYVSTTTLFRFVKKLGFDGYSDFQAAIRETEESSRQIDIPNVVYNTNYQSSYLKNIIEAVQVITDEKKDKFNEIMSRYPKIYILAKGLSEAVGVYLYRLLTMCGYEVEFPTHHYQIQSVLRRIKRDDVLLILSYTGNNQTVIQYIEEIFAISTPTIISITRADNNVIQNMSDLNFYVFADEIQYKNQDVTSHCCMIAILETLMYVHITREQKG
ncbi:MAG: MurR/RpiR family transcriptional regulator [Clostridia bacterium]|nr:MurR/RpiR family transcriptional regulator [Candidatus Pelethousia sp.]NCB31620.1 MurR/RpiR family transcriptional regulator [Clostridia bacterium]